MQARSVVALLALAIVAPVVSPAFAVSVPVVNPSFESPAIDPNTNPFLAVPTVDSWTQSGAANSSGTFYNTAPGNLNFLNLPDHIDNLDLLQGAFISGVAGVGLSQVTATNYTAGNVYSMTVGVGVSASFAPASTDHLDLTFFYMNNGTPTAIATTSIDTSALSATHLNDYTVTTPVVGDNDAWAGQAIGVAINADGGPNGYWDVDNVRVDSEVPEPASLGILGLGATALLTRRRSRKA